MMPKEIKRDTKLRVIKESNMGCIGLPFFFLPIILGLAFIASADFILAKLITMGIIVVVLGYMVIRQKTLNTAKRNPYIFSNKTLVFLPFEWEILLSLPILLTCLLFLVLTFYNAIYVFIFLILPVTGVFIYNFGKMFLVGCSNVFTQIKLALKFGTSKLLHDDYLFYKGEVIGLFFQNEKLIKYTDEVTVTLKNIEEKFVPVRDAENPRKVTKEHKFYCHYTQTRNYALEINKVGLVFELPATNCFATDNEPKNPKYWEIAIKNEACDFHHRFIIDVLDIPDDNKGDL